MDCFENARLLDRSANPRPGIGSVCQIAGMELTFRSSDPTLQVLCLRKSISKGARKFGARIATLMSMDYEKMKALMETNREEPAVQRKPQVTEFPKPDSAPDWTELGYDLIRERIAA
jgi:hypothetical protein